MLKPMDELDVELCNYCDYKGSRQPIAHSFGCEGSRCNEAYDNYLFYNEQNLEKVLINEEKFSL